MPDKLMEDLIMPRDENHYQSLIEALISGSLSGLGSGWTLVTNSA